MVNDVCAKKQSSVPMRNGNRTLRASCVHAPAVHAPQPLKWFSHTQACVSQRLRGSIRSSSAQKATSSDAAVTSTASGAAGSAPRTGRMTYKPESFGEMVDDAVASVQAGLKDGFLQMEVEFPPVPVALDGTCRSFSNRSTYKHRKGITLIRSRPARLRQRCGMVVIVRA